MLSEVVLECCRGARLKRLMLTRPEKRNAPSRLRSFLDSRLTQLPTHTQSFHTLLKKCLLLQGFTKSASRQFEKLWLLQRRHCLLIQRMRGCCASITRCYTRRRSSIADRRKTINLGNTEYITRAGRIRKFT
jgi:hypothetical protein